MTPDVATPSRAYLAMAQDWDLVHDLVGGTRAMRAAGEKWLPREPRESMEAYRIRLSRSVLFNGLARALQILVGKPFQNPITLSDDTDPRIRAMADDVDLCGRNLTVFARDILRAALRDGLTHVMVDYPITKPGASLADERASGLRPYLVHVPAPDVIGWRSTDDGSGTKLSRLRIRESQLEAEGVWVEKRVEQIRVLSPGRFDIHREVGRGADKKWALAQNGQTSFKDIPLFTLYAERLDFMVGRPPLMDLAWLNLAHWQSASDQRHILHVARVPILFGKNLSFGDGEAEIGPNRMIIGEDDGADLRFVEHSGAAIEAGRQDLIDLEDRMALMGLDLSFRKPGNATATAKTIDTANADSALAGIVRGLEDVLTSALGRSAEIMGLDAAAAGQVRIQHGTLQDDERGIVKPEENNKKS